MTSISPRPHPNPFFPTTTGTTIAHSHKAPNADTPACRSSKHLMHIVAPADDTGQSPRVPIADQQRRDNMRAEVVFSSSSCRTSSSHPHSLSRERLQSCVSTTHTKHPTEPTTSTYPLRSRTAEEPVRGWSFDTVRTPVMPGTPFSTIAGGSNVTAAKPLQQGARLSSAASNAPRVGTSLDIPASMRGYFVPASVCLARNLKSEFDDSSDDDGEASSTVHRHFSLTRRFLKPKHDKGSVPSVSFSSPFAGGPMHTHEDISPFGEREDISASYNFGPAPLTAPSKAAKLLGLSSDFPFTLDSPTDQAIAAASAAFEYTTTPSATPSKAAKLLGLSSSPLSSNIASPFGTPELSTSTVSSPLSSPAPKGSLNAPLPPLPHFFSKKLSEPPAVLASTTKVSGGLMRVSQNTQALGKAPSPASSSLLGYVARRPSLRDVFHNRPMPGTAELTEEADVCTGASPQRRSRSIAPFAKSTISWAPESPAQMGLGLLDEEDNAIVPATNTALLPYDRDRRPKVMASATSAANALQHHTDRPLDAHVQLFRQLRRADTAPISLLPGRESQLQSADATDAALQRAAAAAVPTLTATAPGIATSPVTCHTSDTSRLVVEKTLPEIPLEGSRITLDAKGPGRRFRGVLPTQAPAPETPLPSLPVKWDTMMETTYNSPDSSMPAQIGGRPPTHMLRTWDGGISSSPVSRGRLQKLASDHRDQEQPFEGAAMQGWSVRDGARRSYNRTQVEDVTVSLDVCGEKTFEIPAELLCGSQGRVLHGTFAQWIGQLICNFEDGSSSNQEGAEALSAITLPPRASATNRNPRTCTVGSLRRRSSYRRTILAPSSAPSSSADSSSEADNSDDARVVLQGCGVAAVSTLTSNDKKSRGFELLEITARTKLSIFNTYTSPPSSLYSLPIDLTQRQAVDSWSGRADNATADVIEPDLLRPSMSPDSPSKWVGGPPRSVMLNLSISSHSQIKGREADLYSSLLYTLDRGVLPAHLLLSRNFRSRQDSGRAGVLLDVEEEAEEEEVGEEEESDVDPISHPSPSTSPRSSRISSWSSSSSSSRTTTSSSPSSTASSFDQKITNNTSTLNSGGRLSLVGFDESRCAYKHLRDLRREADRLGYNHVVRLCCIEMEASTSASAETQKRGKRQRGLL